MNWFPPQDMALLTILMGVSGFLTWMVLREIYRRRIVTFKSNALQARSDLELKQVRLSTQNDHLIGQLKLARQQSEQLADQRIRLVRQKAVLENRLDTLQTRMVQFEACENRLNEQKARLSKLQQQWTSREVSLSKDLELARRQLKETTRMRDYLEETYGRLSAQALEKNSQAVIQQAEMAFSKYWQGARQELSHQTHSVQQTISPLQTALSRYETHLKDLESSRQKAYGGLLEKIKGLSAAQTGLERETIRLIQSLRSPQVKGRWGEISLKRAVELAGLNNYCDYIEQASHTKSDQAQIRPDMVVQLPGKRSVVLDAKVSLSAYMDAQETDSPEKQTALLKKHAQQLRQHVRSLSGKAYWQQFESAPDFVVMFVPGENFFSAAVKVDPELIDDAGRKNVIIATPTTLISLLKTVAYVWRQDQATQNAKHILATGRLVFQRIQTLTKHFTNLGQDLNRCVNTFNRTVASYEHRLLPSARKLQELGVAEMAENAMEEPKRIQTTVRKPQNNNNE